MSKAQPADSRISLWRDRRLWLVVAVALAVRVGLLAAALGTGASLEEKDTTSYERPALSFLTSGIFSQDESPPYTIDLVRTPGYPLFVAGVWRACGVGNRVAVAAAQIVLAVVAVMLVYAATRRLAGRRGALVAGMLLAVSGLSAALSCFVLSDALYQFWMALWLFLLMRYIGDRSWGNLLAVAVVAGVGIYVRPVGALLPAAVALAALAGWKLADVHGNHNGRREGLGRRIGQAAVALLVPALVVFPWMLRNHLGADTWEPTIINSQSLIVGRAPIVMSLAEGKDAYTVAREELAARAMALTPPEATRGERARIESSVAVDYMRSHLWATARAYADGAVILLLLPDQKTAPHLLGVDEPSHMLHTGGGWYNKARTVLKQYHGLTLAFMTWETGWLALVWLMALVGWLRLRRWGHVAASNALALVLLCLIAVLTCPDAAPRYRAPLLIPLVVLAGAMWLHSTRQAEG